MRRAAQGMPCPAPVLPSSCLPLCGCGSPAPVTPATPTAPSPAPEIPATPRRTLTRPCNPIGLPQALWLRPPGNVSDEEYSKFYKVGRTASWDAALPNERGRAG